MRSEELIKIGIIIKVERKYRKLAQNDLADELSINQSTISRMESGDTNITPLLYEQVLNILNMSSTQRPIHLENELFNIYNELDTSTPQKVEEIHQNSNRLSFLYYKEYFIKQLIYASYLLYYERFEELRELMDYLEEIEFIFSGRVKYIYLMMIGFSYHTTRSYKRADFYFRQAMKFNKQYKLKDGIILYSNTFNHIILGHHHLAQLLLLKLIDNFKVENKYRYFISKKLLGFIYLLDSNYKNTQIVLEECYQNKEIYKHSKWIELQLNSFLGVTYLSLGNYQSAFIHFDNNIKNHYLLELSYAFTLYSLKKLKIKDKFLFYKEMVENENFHKERYKRLFIDIFSNYEIDIDISLLTRHYNLFYHHIFKHNDRFHYTKLFFQLTKEELWKNRKYLLYKQFNDLILEYRLGGNDFGI